MRLLAAAFALLVLAAPAAASDARLERAIRHGNARVTAALDGAKHGTRRSVESAADRASHTARRAERRILRIAPSTRRGATARHLAVHAFQQYAVAGRLLWLAVQPWLPAHRAFVLAQAAFGHIVPAALELANAETLLS